MLPDNFLIENSFACEQNFPGGKYLKNNDIKKSKIWEMLFNLATLPNNRTYRLNIKIVESGISTIVDKKLIFEII